MITNTETRDDLFYLSANVPLSQMFGYATELRGMTSGQGEFTLEYKCHEDIPENEAEVIREKYLQKKKERN